MASVAAGDKEEVLLLVLPFQYLSAALSKVQSLQNRVRAEVPSMCDTAFREHVLFIVCETIW